MKLKELKKIQKNDEIIENDKSKGYKFRSYTNKIINSLWVFLIYIVIVVLKTLLFYNNTIYIDSKMPIDLIIKTVIFVVTGFSVLLVLKNRERFWSGFIINIAISILLFADNIYYLYSNSVVSIAQISNLQYASEISRTLPYLFRINQLLYFLDIVILSILLIKKFIIIIKLEREKIFINVICLIIICVISPLNINNALTDTYQHPYNKRKQIEVGTIYSYHILDIENNINLKKNVKYKNKEDVIEDYIHLKSEYDDKFSYMYELKGIAKDKNVIVLQLESIQQFLVNKKINGKEITPNLNKFLKENINFTNMYAQSYTTTADSEFSTITSVYPMENGMSFSQYYSNKYDDIFGIFKESGYETTFIHGNYGSFWNRQNVYGNMKIDNIFFDDVFGENTERISDYISDEEVYKYIVKEMSEYNEKFFVNIVAASSHTGYGLDGIKNREEKVVIDVGEKYKGTFFGRYLESANYADYAFKVFIDELKENDLYDNSIILVFGDHYGVGATNEELIQFLSETEYEYNIIGLDINFVNVLCGMRIPGISKKEIDIPVSKIDIKPTITEICGLEDGFSLGVSMFKDKEFVCLNNEIIITDKYYYNGDWYLIKTGELIDIKLLDLEEQKKLDQYYNYMKRELDMSISINVHNLLAK